MIPKGAIFWLVGREHVSTPNLTIVRLLRNRMRGPEWTKAYRKEAYRYALEVHKQNRALYGYVMGGH